MIPFNKTAYTGNEDSYILEAVHNQKLSSKGPFTQRCEAWLEEQLNGPRVLVTGSCTQALEIAAIILDIQPGDEVIMPSYTFVSTANAFALRGAQIVFVDIDPATMNVDPALIEAAITPKTKAIVPVHYAGIGCDMERIMAVAEAHQLYVVEDAAQCLMASYNGKALGTFGHISTFSFHETKNYTAGGKGGFLAINDERFMDRAEIIREKGTNRSQFFRGSVDKYTWVDLGSSHLMSELQAAYLWGQLEKAHDILDDRMQTWNCYYEGLADLASAGKLELPSIPAHSEHNAHLFYLKLRDLSERTALIAHLKASGIQSTFHYVPLHSAPAGQRFGRFHGEDRYTTRESERLLRLPLWFGMNPDVRQAPIHTLQVYFLS